MVYYTIGASRCECCWTSYLGVHMRMHYLCTYLNNNNNNNSYMFAAMHALSDFC